MSNMGRKLGRVKHSCANNDGKQLPPLAQNDHGKQWLLELQRNSSNFDKDCWEEFMDLCKET